MTHSRNTAWRLPKVTALRNHQLDATITAYIGYLFKSGNSLDYGKRPVEDTELTVLQEGLIVQPVKKP